MTSQNMYWMERLHLTFQEIKNFSGEAKKAYIAWDAKKMPVAGLLEHEAGATIKAIGQMPAGKGARPLTVLEVEWKR